MSSEKLNFGEVVALAAIVHAEQKDGAGQPYILHPFRVAARCGSEKAQRVAFLHDAIEDGPPDVAEALARGLPDDELEAVLLLTRSKGQSYDDFISDIIASKNPLAIEVKLADLADNLDPARLAKLPAERGAALAARYRKANRILMQVAFALDLPIPGVNP